MSEPTTDPTEPDGCNFCGCVWDEEGYCACDRAAIAGEDMPE